MSARLSLCTKEEQRSVIRFLWAEGVNGAEIHARLCTQYEEKALPLRSVYEWIEMFKNGRTSVMDAEGWDGHQYQKLMRSWKKPEPLFSLTEE